MDSMEDSGSNMEVISGSKKKKGKKVSQKVSWIRCHSDPVIRMVCVRCMWNLR